MNGRWIWFWGPVAAYTGLIFWLASSTRPIPGMDLFPHMDKLFHGVEYLPYGVLWIRAVRSSNLIRDRFLSGKIRWRSVLAIAFLCAVTVGALDEWTQGFRPFKTADFLDWGADAVGVFLGQLLYVLKVAKTPQWSEG